jgi:hypothetical protein
MTKLTLVVLDTAKPRSGGGYYINTPYNWRGMKVKCTIGDFSFYTEGKAGYTWMDAANKYKKIKGVDLGGETVVASLPEYVSIKLKKEVF